MSTGNSLEVARSSVVCLKNIVAVQNTALCRQLPRGSILEEKEEASSFATFHTHSKPEVILKNNASK